MATNRRKSSSRIDVTAGRALLDAREDIRTVQIPSMISARISTKLKEHAPVRNVALGGTRFGEPGSRPLTACWR
jgi:hypothetical protein